MRNHTQITTITNQVCQIRQSLLNLPVPALVIERANNTLRALMETVCELDDEDLACDINEDIVGIINELKVINDLNLTAHRLLLS